MIIAIRDPLDRIKRLCTHTTEIEFARILITQACSYLNATLSVQLRPSILYTETFTISRTRDKSREITFTIGNQALPAGACCVQVCRFKFQYLELEMRIETENVPEEAVDSPLSGPSDLDPTYLY